MSRAKRKPENCEENVAKTKQASDVQTEEVVPLKQEELETEIQNLKTALAKAEEEKENYLDLARRSRAEFDNYRKRNATLYSDSLEEGRREVLTKLLPIIDNLERAVSAESDSAESIRQGVEMTLRTLMETLAGLSCVSLEAKAGIPFDPELHNAVMTVPADEEHPDNTIYDVFQQGYKVKDHVIRHAMVRVSKSES